MSVYLIVILVLIILLLSVIIYAIFQHKKYKETKIKLQNKTEAYTHLQEEFELYRKAETFKHQKEEEANEKIYDLHSGALSADDILPKRKS